MNNRIAKASLFAVALGLSVQSSALEDQANNLPSAARPD